MKVWKVYAMLASSTVGSAATRSLAKELKTELYLVRTLLAKQLLVEN